MLASPRVPELDAVRAIAVLGVVAGHAYLLGGTAPPHTSRAPGDLLINAGGQGIWLFFALSGYLIAGPFVRALARGEPLPDTGRYALRRAARIVPAYWIALATLLVLVPVALDWWQVPLHGALVHNLVPGEGQALFFVAWTLGIEALFYTFVPLAAWLARRITGPRPISARALTLTVVGMWVASTAWSLWAAAEYPNVGPFAAVENADVFRLSLPALLSAFCPGILVAVAREAGSPLLARRAEPLLAAALALAGAALLLNTTSSTVVLDASRQVWAVAAGLVLVAALAGWGRLGPAARALAPIGLVSYGLYLWHWVALKVLQEEGVSVQVGIASWPLRIAILLAVSLPFAVASWVLVEKPLLRLTRPTSLSAWTRRGTRSRSGAAARGGG